MLVIQKDNNPSFIKWFLLFIQLLYGIDFGFAAILKRKCRSVIKFITISMAVVWIIILLYVVVRRPNDPWAWFNILKFVSYFFILNTLKYTVHELLNDINEIHIMSTTQKIYLCAIPIGYWIILNSIKIGLMVVRCKHEIDTYCAKFDNLVIYAFYCTVVVGMDSIAVTQTVIYYYIRCCIQNIKYSFLKPNLKLKHFKERYWEIAKCYNNIRPLYDLMIILELIIMVPKMMATIWAVMYYLNKNAHWYSYMTEIIFAFHMAIQIATPAIVAEMVNSQVDSITLLLKENLLKERDEKTSANIKHTLELLDTLPLNHLVLRFIPIDIRLLLALFSVCSTYFIVIVQFSHMYD